MYARFSFLSLEDITWQCTVHMAVALFCLSMIMFCINYFSVSYQCVSQFSSCLLNGESSPYSTTTIIRDGCAESNVQCRAELFGIVEKKRKKVDKHTLKMYNKNVTWSFSFMCEKKLFTCENLLSTWDIVSYLTCWKVIYMWKKMTCSQNVSSHNFAIISQMWLTQMCNSGRIFYGLTNNFIV